MLGIQTIASYVPNGRQSNIDSSTLAAFDIKEDFVRNKIGVLSRAVKDSGEDTSDLALKALRKVCEKAGIELREIQALVVVTQNPDNNLPHVAAQVHGKAELPDHCAAFDISLGCSGYVYGLSIITSFMASNGFERGVLITADPYSKIVDRADKNTSLLFGDAATATLISNRPIFAIGPFSFGTKGSLSDALICRDGKLHMNGREVFNLTATGVPPDILNLLQVAGLNKDEVDLYLLHQGSKYIVDTIRGRLGVPAEKVPLGLEEVGNTVSSSIPLLLESAISRDSITTMVLSGFGVGLSWASCVCKKGS